MSKLDRRQWLQLSSLGLAGMATGAFTTKINALAPVPAANGPNDKVLFVFLRGAMDALHTIVPHGDGTYPGQRGSIALPMTSTVPLSGVANNFARLNRDFGVLASGAGNPDAAGHAAWIMQVGHDRAQRSHFTEQQIYETADVQDPEALNPEGFAARLAKAGAFFPTLPAASVSPRMQRMFRSTDPQAIMAHIKSLQAYDIGADDGPYNIPGLQVRLRTALNQHLAQTPSKAINRYIDKTGEFAMESEALVKSVTFQHDPMRFPLDSNEAAGVTPALMPSSSGYRLMTECEEALQLLLQTGCRAVGVEFGGWDTHADQLSTRPLTDTWLAKAIHSLYQLTVSLSTMNVTICVMTEFGRTNAVNNTQPDPGTDHGVGGLMMFFGKSVKGGLYHCRDAMTPGLGQPWNDIGNPRTAPYQNALEVQTDFRALLAELFAKRFAMSTAQIDTIIPGWSGIVASQPPSELPRYLPLDFLN